MSNEGARRQRLPTWLPLGFVSGALVLLLAIPFIIHRRVGDIRQTADVWNEARVLLSEFEGAFAHELTIVGGEGYGDTTIEAKRAAAIATERATQRALDSVSARLGAGVVHRLDTLRTAQQRWRALNALPSSPTSERTQAQRFAVGREVVEAAESLRRYLTAVSISSRDEVRRVDRFDFRVSVALAAIALAAMAMVIALDRRVRRYAREADDRARQLERSVELRATLIHGVVHDVKNPLGAASGYAELLEEGAAGTLNEKQREMVSRFKRLVGTAVQTVTELVELARVDAGEYAIERRPMNLVSTVREIVEDHRGRAARKSIALSFASPTDSLWLNTDQARVRHVVENLLSNALKYTPAGGRVEAAVNVEPDDRSGSRVAVSVRDTGPGIPPDLRDRIFDPFFRAPSSEQSVPGSGMGLAISRRIAGLLGGTVRVTDAPGRGSKFVFNLPMADMRRARS